MNLQRDLIHVNDEGNCQNINGVINDLYAFTYITHLKRVFRRLKHTLSQLISSLMLYHTVRVE